MPRSLLIPLLGLAAIILYGTTQAARPTAEEMSGPERTAPVEVRRPTLRAAPPAEPPPAPRLRSEVEAEEAALADSAGSDAGGPTDGRGVPPGFELPTPGPAQSPNTPIP